MIRKKSHQGQFKASSAKFSCKPTFVRANAWALFCQHAGFLQEKHLVMFQKNFKRTFGKSSQLRCTVTKLPLGITQKPLGSRLGKGKGNVSFRASKVYPGTMLFEISNAPFSSLTIFLKKIQSKFPVSLFVGSYTRPFRKLTWQLLNTV